MPYIVPNKRKKKNKAVFKIKDLLLEDETKISGFIYYYCLENIEPSYNNYKNFIGEVRQSINEICRRSNMDINVIYNVYSHSDIPDYYVEPNFKEFIEFKKTLYNVDVKFNGDFNYILYKLAKELFSIPPKDWQTKMNLRDYLCSLLIVIRKIEKNILTPYEEKKRKENGSIE